ncbi:MAG: CAP domain-containing protein [Fibrobacter sp.]|nr:CAP domain-containing protein [Fibrobacter sp.]
MKINLFGNMAKYATGATFAFAMSCVVSGCSEGNSVTYVENTYNYDDLSSSSVKKVSSSSEKTARSSSSSQKPTNSSSSETVAASSSSKKSTSSSSSEKSSSSTENSFFSATWREDCLAKINEYRATENLKPLTLAPEEKQTCTDQEAADDLAENKAHGHFGNCGEGAQNSGPNFNTSWRKTATDATNAFLKMMWEDEKALVVSGKRDPDKNEDYSYIGHYLNMKGNYKTVACGIALTEDGKKGWLNINFFR